MKVDNATGLVSGYATSFK